MKLGIFAKTFKGSTAGEVLNAARRAGYDAVQYNLACSGISSLPEAIEPAIATSIRDAARETGIAIAAVSATYNMIHPDLSERQKGRRSFEAIAASAQGMGTRLLTVCTGSRDAENQWRRHSDNTSAAAWRDMCDEFARLVAIAEKFDVLIGVEPELANVIDGAHRAREMIDAIRSDRIRIVLDPANLFEIEPPERRQFLIAEAVDLLADRIELAHAKDRYGDGRFAAAGDGVIDFSFFVSALRASGFGGALITHGLAEDDAARVANFLRVTLETTGCKQ